MLSETSRIQLIPPEDEFTLDLDRIVITSLKNAGYAIEWEDRRLKNYNFEEIINMVIFCLKNLFPEKCLPESIPFGMQNRYRLCTQLAEIVQSLNYTGEIGYHTFMYNNKEPIRNILVFLSDQLSRTDYASTLKQKENNKKLSIKLRVKEELKKILSSKNKDCHSGLNTTPFISLPLETGIVLPAQKLNCKPIEWKEYVVQKLPYIDDQLPWDRCFLPSIVSLNNIGQYFPKRIKKISYSYGPSSDEFPQSFANSSNSAGCDSLRTLNPIQAEKVDKNSETEKAVIEVGKKINEIQPHVKQLSSEVEKAKNTSEKLQKMLVEKLSKQSAMEHSLNLLPNSEENKEKLKNLIEKNREKIDSLQLQTNNHKLRLREKLGKLQKIEEDKLLKKSRSSEKISQIRTDVFGVVEQIEQRKILYEQLQNRAQSIRGEDRSVHVQRIFKFIENLKKQETEILNIITDMREVQIAINTESEKADRCFLVASQLLKDHVSTDNFSAKAYQLLLTVHKLISDIIQLDNERVNQEKAVAQLEYELLNHEIPASDALKDIRHDLNKLKSDIAEIEISVKKKEKKLRRLMKINKSKLASMDKNG